MINCDASSQRSLESGKRINLHSKWYLGVCKQIDCEKLILVNRDLDVCHHIICPILDSMLDIR